MPPPHDAKMEVSIYSFYPVLYWLACPTQQVDIVVIKFGCLGRAGSWPRLSQHATTEAQRKSLYAQRWYHQNESETSRARKTFQTGQRTGEPGLDTIQ
jgi:hypothetical protein